MRLSGPLAVCLVLSVTISIRLPTDALRHNAGKAWRATLKLGEAQNGGTNSAINIKLYDKDGFQESVTLNRQRIPLGKGMPHNFRFYTRHLGMLSKVELFLSIPGNPWHLETFQLKNIETAQSYTFRIGGYSTNETFSVPQEKVKLWRIQVQVGASREAGTRGMVRIRLQGSKGTSEPIRLRSPYHQEFRPGETIDFYFATSDIGHFDWAQVVVGQWDLMYLERLVITDIDESKQFTFNYSGFVMNKTFYSNEKDEKAVAVEKKFGDEADTEPNVTSPHRNVSPLTRESPLRVATPSVMPTIQVTSGQSVTSLGQQTKVTLDNNRYGSVYTPHRLPAATIGNSVAESRVTLTTKSTTTPNPTKSLPQRPTTNPTIETGTTTTRTIRSRTTRTTASYKSKTVKIINKNFVFDSKNVASPTSQQQKSRTSKRTQKVLSSSKEEARDVDIWDSVLGEDPHDFPGVKITSSRSPLWEPRRATLMSWKPRTRPTPKTPVYKPVQTNVEMRPVKLTPLNEKNHNLSQLVSSKGLTIERSSSSSSSGAVVPVTGQLQTEETQVGDKLALESGRRSKVKKVAEEYPRSNIQVHPTTKTTNSTLQMTTRPASIVHPPLSLKPVSNSKSPRPDETDAERGGSIITEERPFQSNRSLAGQRSKAQNEDTVVKKKMGPFDVASPSRNSSVVDTADPISIGQRSNEDVSHISLGVNLPTAGQRSKGDVPRISPGVTVPKAGADLEERLRLDLQRPVQALEFVAKTRPFTGESDHAVKAPNRQTPWPNNKKVDWTPSNQRPNKDVMQGSRLSGAYPNQDLGEEEVEQKPFKPSSIKAGGRSGSVNIDLSVNLPRHKVSGIGTKISETDNLPDLGDILRDFGDSQFQPDVFQDTTIFEEIEGCHLTAYEEDERYYLEEVTGFNSVIRPCPIGTVFRRMICACTAPENGAKQSSSKCNVEFELDFEHGIKDSSGKNLFALSENVYVEHSAGRFVGNSHISLWRFQTAEFGDKLTIRLSFKPDGYRAEIQQLVGNCVPNAKPSISISIDQPRRKVLYNIVTDAYSESIETSFNRGSWNEVALVYNGKTMQSITNGVQSFKHLEGKIRTSGSPLKFGFCETTHGFRGLLDSVQIYMCVPNENAAVV